MEIYESRSVKIFIFLLFYFIFKNFNLKLYISVD
jgi:hypothetical protein